MSVYLKNFNLLRNGLKLKTSYFASRYVNEHAVYYNDQIEYLKSVTKNDNNLGLDWAELKNDLLKKRGAINEKNIDAVIVKLLVNNNKIDKALLFTNYLKSSNTELSLGVINSILHLYYVYAQKNDLSDNDKQFILDTYKKLYKKYKVLDNVTCEKLLHALCSINEWDKCMKLLDDISFTGTPSHSAYSTLIATFFKNNKKADALKLIEKSIQNRRPLTDIAYDEWIKFIFRKYKDKSTLLKYLNELCNHLNDKCAVVTAFTAQRLKESFEKLNWNGKFTGIIKYSGTCKHCQETLDCYRLTEEEFGMLQKNVKDKLIVGSDLFLKTSPDELNKFLNFIKKSSPYDVVLDALNIALSVGKGDVNDRIRVLSAVVDHFAQRKKKILLLGRKHMLNWRRLDSVLYKTEYFFTENLSQDDPYFITAAILSGSHTDIVSRDLLRGHKFLMQQEHLRKLFQRWQWQHQWMVFVPNHKPIIQAPLNFTPVAQKSKNGWHLPYISKHLGNEHEVTPDCATWLCLRHTSKEKI